jgi:phosphoglycerate dehydrogenase-like enzyme
MKYLLCAVVLAGWVCLLPPAASAAMTAGEAADRVPAMIADLELRADATPVRERAGWRTPDKVVVRVVPSWFDGGYLQLLQEVAPGVTIVPVESVEAAIREIADAQVLIGFCDEEILAAGPGVQWVQVYSSGVDRCVGNPGLSEGERLLTNGQRLASPALAEHAIALTLALARGLDLYHANQLQGSWQSDVGLTRGEFMELAGRTMLVVGLGGIGTQVARRAHGLGMRVIATRGSSREGPDYVDYVGLAGEVNELARQADVVVNAAPLTDATRGMFDAEFFRAMKPGAYFVSVGRGASTVTADLLAALEAGEIAGAGLDVTDPEPLPADHPLWRAPRVLISPHTAGRSDRSRERLFLLVFENLRRYVAGEPLLSVVDIERGY